jgi:hypothetical protein
MKVTRQAYYLSSEQIKRASQIVSTVIFCHNSPFPILNNLFFLGWATGVLCLHQMKVILIYSTELGLSDTGKINITSIIFFNLLYMIGPANGGSI